MCEGLLRESERERERWREKEEARYTKEEIYLHISEKENVKKRGGGERNRER